MMISTKDRALVLDTYVKLARSEASLTQTFYARLFEVNPAFRELFMTDMVTQGVKLRLMLNAIVLAMDNFNLMKSRLGALGKHHAGYRVKREDYLQFMEALIWTFKKQLQGEFTPAVEAAWRNVLCTAVEYMVRDVHEAPANSG